MLTTAQLSTINDLKKLRIQVGCVGLDRFGRPVIWIADERRQFQMAIEPEGNGTDAYPPYHYFTPEEQEAMNDNDVAALLNLPIKQPTKEIWS